MKRPNVIAKKYFSFLWYYYQILKILIDKYKKNSFSQYQEDIIIAEIVKNYNIDSNSNYIDIGANHPTRLSNTFYFYKKGFHGVLIEPNINLARLNKQFRKRDIVLNIGVGNKNAIAEFKYTASHVLNTFVDIEEKNVIKKEYVPIFRLDEIIKSFKDKFNKIFLLNIDVEGSDFEVLASGDEMLSQISIICIEANDSETKAKIIDYLSEKHNFNLYKEIECNLIFINKALTKRIEN
jgi:FkbM family methyltransferase